MYKKAAEIFELAIQVRPMDLTSYQAAATAWMEAGNPGKAIQNLEAAIKIDPADETSYVMLAEIYGKQNNTGEQNRALEMYLKFRPQSIEFRQRRAKPASETEP
jgi:predicted Zn-dependent protease